MAEGQDSRVAWAVALGAIVFALAAVVWLWTPETVELVTAASADEAEADGVEPGVRPAPKVGRDLPEATDEAPPPPVDLKLPGQLPKLRLPPVEPDYGRLDTAGQLPKEAGAAALSAFYPHAIMCLVEARKKDPNVGSRITLRLLVVPGEDGKSRLADLDAIDKGKTSRPLRDCLRKVSAEVALDLGPGVRGTVTAPMVLGKDPEEPPPGAMMPMQEAGTEQVIDDEGSDEPPASGADEHGTIQEQAASGPE